MTEPVHLNLGADDLLPLASAMSWLMGFVEGAGRPLPEHVERQRAQLAEWIARVSP